MFRQNLQRMHRSSNLARVSIRSQSNNPNRKRRQLCHAEHNAAIVPRAEAVVLPLELRRHVAL